MQKVFITGCSGYIGSLLVDTFSKRDDVSLIVGLDMKPLSPLTRENPKLHFIQKNTSDDWEDEVSRYKPDIVIHAAWQIKELYSQKSIQEKWNINGTHKVFDFVFNQSDVKKLIHFGSVASYGAYRSNTLEDVFTEKISLRKSSYVYAEEKRVSESMLKDLYEKYGNHKDHLPKVYIVRPASVIGPYGKKRTGTSLQTILKGSAKDSVPSIIISKILSFMPSTKKWARQYIHEDDIVGAIEHLAFEDFPNDFDTLNLCPPGRPILAKDMASYLGKKSINIPFIFIKQIFFIAWHLTRGRVPTGRGADKAYAYPIIVNGEKISKEYGYKYIYSTEDALKTNKGQYI